jgi:RHS repeat-associated protein
MEEVARHAGVLVRSRARGRALSRGYRTIVRTTSCSWQPGHVRSYNTHSPRPLTLAVVVVYHGRQTANQQHCNPMPMARRVFLYPMEYRMYGPDGVAVVWERDQNAQLVPRAVSTDAQGSERYVHGTGMALSRDYRAFGVELGLMQPQRRTGWIGKERDHETSPLFPAHKLMDLSASRYDPMTALFTSVDELWASFPQQHGYHYAYHDPVNFSDPSGRDPLANPLKPNPRPYRHVSRANDRDFMTFVIAHRMRENAEPAGIMDNQLFRDYAVQERQSQEVLPKITSYAAGMQTLVNQHYDPNATAETGIVLYEVGGQVHTKYYVDANPRSYAFDADAAVNATIDESPSSNILAVHHFHLLNDEEAGILPPSLRDVLYAAFASDKGVDIGFTVFTRVGSETFAITMVDLDAARAFGCAFLRQQEDVFPNYSEYFIDNYGDFVLSMLAAINKANSGILIHRRLNDETPFELVK